MHGRLKNDFNTVHEHLTNFAINEYLEPAFYLRNPKVALVNRAGGDSVDFITGAEWPKGVKPQHTTYGIIYGSWWNDDLLMLTWGEDANFTTRLLKLGGNSKTPMPSTLLVYKEFMEFSGTRSQTVRVPEEHLD